MREIGHGLWHWTARHEHIRMPVSSYYLASERVAIDVMIPEQGLEWFEQHGAPQHVLEHRREVGARTTRHGARRVGHECDAVAIRAQ